MVFTRTCKANDGPNTEEANHTNYQTGRRGADCVKEVALKMLDVRTVKRLMKYLLP